VRAHLYFFCGLGAGALGIFLLAMSGYFVIGIVGVAVAYIFFCVGQREKNGHSRRDD
jgi:hypothetical protein